MMNWIKQGIHGIVVSIEMAYAAGKPIANARTTVTRANNEIAIA
jgi:hypothetical protein